MADGRMIGGVAILVLLAGSGLALRPAGKGIDAARVAAENAAWRTIVDAVAASRGDNDPIADARDVTNPVLFGTPAPATVWPVRRGGERVSTVIRVPVPEGYNGRLDVVTGIDEQGAVSGVSVARHRETADYGGRLVREPSFLARFLGRTASGPAASWEVAPGSGAVDGVTGATITMTAVTNGVLRALRQHAVMAAGPSGEAQ